MPLELHMTLNRTVCILLNWPLVPRYVGSTVSVLPFGGRGERTTEVEYAHHIIKFTCFKFALQYFLVNLPSCANITPVQFGHIFIT